MLAAERILHEALVTLNEMIPYSGYEVGECRELVEKTLEAHAAHTKHRIEPIQWNNYIEEQPPIFGRECKDHPAVRGTHYMEVHHLVGTSGCSPLDPCWGWVVLGVIENSHGKQLVCPGDWILEPTDGVYVVMSNTQYAAMNNPALAPPTAAILARALVVLRIVNNVPISYLDSNRYNAIRELKLTTLETYGDDVEEMILKEMFKIDRSGIYEASGKYDQHMKGLKATTST